SIVIEELHSRHGNNSDIGVAYVYCNYKRHSEQKPEALMASVLRQLAQEQQSLPDAVKILYEKNRFKGTRPSIDEISQTLHSVSGHFSQLFIVMDALDECGESRDRILDEVFNLQVKHNLNFLATSRSIPEITARFEGMPSQEIRAS